MIFDIFGSFLDIFTKNFKLLFLPWTLVKDFENLPGKSPMCM